MSVTLVDDVISAVTVTPHATDPTSLDYQTRFAQAVPALVVGRNIDDVRSERKCPWIALTAEAVNLNVVISEERK